MDNSSSSGLFKKENCAFYGLIIVFYLKYLEMKFNFIIFAKAKAKMGLQSFKELVK